MATRIADNPKIWARLPSPEERPEDRPIGYVHEWNMATDACKACGMSRDEYQKDLEPCQAKKP
jgi:hypothetical protein